MTYRVDDPGYISIVMNARIEIPHVYELLDFCVHLLNLKCEMVPGPRRFFTLPVTIFWPHSLHASLSNAGSDTPRNAQGTHGNIILVYTVTALQEQQILAQNGLSYKIITVTQN